MVDDRRSAGVGADDRAGAVAWPTLLIPSVARTSNKQPAIKCKYS